MLKLEHDRARRQLRRRTRFLCGLACLMFGVTGTCTAAADYSSRSYPLPINIDSTFVRSSLYLQFEARDYNLSVADFAKRSLSPEELLFVRAAQEIHNKNAAGLAAIWGDPRPQKEAPQGSLKISEITPAQVAAEYAVDFVDLQKPKLISEVLAGSSTLFVWETTNDGTPIRLGLEVNADDKKKLWIKDTDSVRNPIENLIVLTMNEALRDPTGYAPSANPGTKYRYAFPLAGKGNPGAHPVYMRFSGEPMNFPVYDAAVNAPSPLLDSYRNGYLAFKNKKFAAFTSMHTLESQTKLKEYVAAANADTSGRMAQRVNSVKFVKFVLDADPVYLVFYSGIQTDDWPPGSLGYDCVYKDPASGAYLLTNFLFQGFLEGIFRDASMFNQWIFKPAIKPDSAKLQQGK